MNFLLTFLTNKVWYDGVEKLNKQRIIQKNYLNQIKHRVYIVNKSFATMPYFSPVKPKITLKT